jgi:protein SCO1/2
MKNMWPRNFVLYLLGILAGMLGATWEPAAPAAHAASAGGASPGAQKLLSKSLTKRPFSLIDHRGEVVTNRSFQGRFMLVFFGYTYCPDICPTGLQTMSTAIDMLGEVGKKIVPVFVTVDPERDTPKVLAAYVTHFHPKTIGLTGSTKQIASVAKAYRARYFKVFAMPFESDDDAKEPKNLNSKYSMSHSSSTYLVGTDGRILTTFAYGVPAKKMAKQIRPFLVPQIGSSGAKAPDAGRLR